MKKAFILIVLLLLSISIFAEDTEPKNVKFISQSCSQVYFYITVIDLSTNEIVILQYGSLMGGASKLTNVIHTGMIVNPDEENIKDGTDAPFAKAKGSSK